MQFQTAPIAEDDAPGPAGPSSSVESDDDDDIICLDDVVHPVVTTPPRPPAPSADPNRREPEAGPLPVSPSEPSRKSSSMVPPKTEEPEDAMEEEDEEVTIIDPPSKPAPVAVTIDDDSSVAEDAPKISQSRQKEDLGEKKPAAATRNPFTSMFATDEDVKRVGTTEVRIIPARNWLEVRGTILER